MSAWDVVVVGAGPVGLSLALGVARAGRSVVVLEKNASTGEHSKAPTIWPGTQEVLEELGVIDRFRRRGIAVDELALDDVDRDRVLARFPLGELADETIFPQLLIVPQSVTETLLCEAVREQPTAEIRFSSEVLAASAGDDLATVEYRGVGGTESLEARFVIGCDGAHSQIRKALGCSFNGITYGMRVALADVILPDEARALPFPRFTTRGGLAVGIRIDAELWRLILFLAADGEAPLLERIGRAVPALFGVDDYETVWMSEFTLHRRISSSFGHGRMALAGDAAHLNSPVGAQGMNAGIQDTIALREALLEALARGEPSAVEAYARTRRREIRVGVNRFTNIITRGLLLADGGLVRPVMRCVALALRWGPIRRRVLRRIAMLHG